MTPLEVRLERPTGALTLRFDGETEIEGTATALDGNRIALTLLGETLALEDPRALIHRRLHVAASDGEVQAPMAGKVLEVPVRKGDAVE